MFVLVGCFFAIVLLLLSVIVLKCVCMCVCVCVGGGGGGGYKFRTIFLQGQVVLKFHCFNSIMGSTAVINCMFLM